MPADSFRRWRALLPLVLVSAASAALGIAFWIIYSSAQVSLLPAHFQVAPATPPALDFVKERLELYDRRARDLQWLLGALFATGAIFSLLQGVFAFFSVQNFNSQAESGLKKIDATRTELEREFREQFPLAAKMEELLNDALNLLDSYFQDADSYENLFHKIGAQGRQEVLFYERVITGFASLKVPKFRERLGRAFRDLGSFYTSKFREAGHSSPPGILKQVEEDLERASFYFGKALERNDQDFAAMNMLGYIALTCQSPPDVQEARRLFSQSCQTQPDQQRAYFNLANIAYTKDGDVDGAIQLYREALGHRRWEYKASLQHATYLKFNLACVLVQRWDKTGADAAANEAIDLLTDSMETGRQYIKTFLDKECQGTGDLVPLQKDPAYAIHLNKIRGL